MYIGKSLLRDEDLRLLTGRGEYTDDVHLPRCTYAVCLRSPHANARICHLRTEIAARMPGVLCVLDAASWESHGVGRWLPSMVSVEFDDGRPMNEISRPVFAREKVCHVGDTVVAVIAETVERGLDALEAIEVDYEELPVVSGTHEAASADGALAHSEFGTNVAFEISSGDPEGAARGFERAAHVTSLEVRSERVSGNALEPRTYIGSYDAKSGRYTLWASAQLPHRLRRWLAKHTFSCPLSKVRVIAPDVGGGFGTKAFFYPEQPIVLLASKLTGRPVRFTATRSEGLQTDAQARDFTSHAEMAFDASTRIPPRSTGARSCGSSSAPGCWSAMSGVWRIPATT